MLKESNQMVKQHQQIAHKVSEQCLHHLKTEKTEMITKPFARQYIIAEQIIKKIEEASTILQFQDEIDNLLFADRMFRQKTEFNEDLREEMRELKDEHDKMMKDIDRPSIQKELAKKRGFASEGIKPYKKL